MKKTSSFILMATTIVGAVIAKNVSPLVLQNQPSKVILAESEEKNKSINSFNTNTTADVTPISIVEVVRNNNSGIQYANYTATLEDGTLLGFSISSSTAYFCGAISSSKSVTVPETISYNNKTYTVKYIGRYSGSSYVLDFEKATSVGSLTIPSTATDIYSSIPSMISELHILGMTPPSIYTKNINTGITVYVPKEAFTTYQNYCTLNKNGWNTSIDLKIEGWTPQSYTISVNTAGTLAYKLLEVVSQWTDVDELTISGHLNAEDMKYFSRMTQLRKLDLSQTDISSIGGCSGLTKLSEVVLPSTVKEVEDNAFSGCSMLSNISLTNVETIGSRAFYLCAKLTSLSLDKVKEIGYLAFSMDIYDDPRATPGISGGLISVSMPKVTDLSNRAFSGCSQLKYVSIPNATSVGAYAFANCIKLSTMDLSNVKELGEGVFYNIGYANVYLRSILLSDELENIPKDCFYGCKNLSDLTLPKSLKSIGYEAIPYWASEVIIPEGVTSIGSGNFTNSSSITIPSTAQIIGRLGGKNLQHVYCNVIAPLSSKCFDDTYAAQATLHVPAFSVNAYKLSDEWYHFNSIVPIDKELGDVTFNNDFTLTSSIGLANKPNFSVVSFNDNENNPLSSSEIHNSGHLTVATDVALPLGKYMQEQNFYYTYDYVYDGNGNSTRVYTYPYVSTLVNNSEMTADEVIVKMWLPQNQWNFISLPFDVNVSDIVYPDGTLWVIRKYNGANRAAMVGDTWQNMTNGQTLNAGEGYILHCTNEDDDNSSSRSNYKCFTFKAVNNSKKNNIFTATDVEQPLNTYASEFAHNRSWNLIGNPYPSFYNSQDIEHEGVITVWNGNGYTAYSLVDDDYYLRPNEAFFVQCPTNKASMKFNAEGRSHEYTSNSAGYNRARVTRKMAKSDDNRHLYNFTLSNGQYTDKARLVLNENAKLDYEMSCDASKFMSSNFSVPQLYIIEKEQRLSIDERPLSDGVIALGVFCGTTDEYTISLATTSENNSPIILIDKETGTETDLIHNVYHFKATTGTYNERFAIKLGNNTTGVLHIEDNKENKKDIYNLNGQKLQTPQKGINIINNKKVIVK